VRSLRNPVLSSERRSLEREKERVAAGVVVVAVRLRGRRNKNTHTTDNRQGGNASLISRVLPGTRAEVTSVQQLECETGARRNKNTESRVAMQELIRLSVTWIELLRRAETSSRALECEKIRTSKRTRTRTRTRTKTRTRTRTRMTGSKDRPRTEAFEQAGKRADF
jgi:hypothetical protein